MHRVLLLLLMPLLAGCADMEGPVDVVVSIENTGDFGITYRFEVVARDGTTMETWNGRVEPGESEQHEARHPVEDIGQFRVTVHHGSGGTSGRGMHGGCSAEEPVRFTATFGPDGLESDLTCDERAMWRTGRDGGDSDVQG